MDKLFKKIFMLVVALVATTAFAACGDDDGDDNGGGTVITGLTVTPTSLNFTKLGGSQVVSAQAQQQATAQSSADWCTVTIGSQTPTLKVTPITVTVAANNTTEARTRRLGDEAGSRQPGEERRSGRTHARPLGQHHHEGAGDSKGYGAGLELG